MPPVTVPGDYQYFKDANGVTITKAKQLVQILNAYAMPLTVIVLEGIGQLSALLTLDDFNEAFAGQVNDTDKYRIYVCEGTNDDQNRYMINPQNAAVLLSTLKKNPDLGDVLEIATIYLAGHAFPAGTQAPTPLELVTFSTPAGAAANDKAIADWAPLKK